MNVETTKGRRAQLSGSDQYCEQNSQKFKHINVHRDRGAIVVHIVGQMTHVDGGPEAIGAEYPDALKPCVLTGISVDHEVGQSKLPRLSKAVGLISVGASIRSGR